MKPLYFNRILFHYKKVVLLFLRLVFLFVLPSYAIAQSNNGATPTAIISSQACFNTAGTIVGATYTAGTGLPGTICNQANPDVWYTFVAGSPNPTITVAQIAGAGSRRFQLFSGAWGSLVELACSGATNTIVAAGLRPGQAYIIRVYSGIAGTFTFNICITDPHDDCASASLITSDAACTNVPGNMYGADLTSPPTIAAPDCATGPPSYDVFYRFVAQTTNPTITLSSIGSSFTNARLQLLSGACGGFVSMFCGTTSIAADYLTPGTTYYIRVYSANGVLPPTPTNASFNICIDDPVTPPPFNDNCANAVNLPLWINCANIPGDMAGATTSGVALGGTCTGPLVYDVWYKFIAISSTVTITLSSIGTNFLATRGVEILSGSCGSLTSIACAATSASAGSLTIGNTYYVRIYSNTAPIPNGNARFNICATTTAAPVRFGNSYVNVTKKTTGGVVQTGDILEIRMTINHSLGTKYNLRFVNNIPTNTIIAPGGLGNDSIWIRTNEGLTYKRYSMALADDAGRYNAAPGGGQYNIRLNLGFGGTNPGIPVNTTATEFASATGTMNAATDRPRGNGLLFNIAYRVQVTGSTGDTIRLAPAQFLYKGAAGAGPDTILTTTPFNIVISDPLFLCSNSIGVNNASEFGGTFGTGTTLNRSTDLTDPIDGYTFVSNTSTYVAINDGRYGIVKNMSPQNGTIRNGRRRPNCNVPAVLSPSDLNNCNFRMFGGFWYVDGDHSGTTNATGNVPPATSTNSGYMLLVNADYVASVVHRQTINNLCPNTYYEFSAWVRNVCPTCGMDSTGAQFTGTPTAPANGYPGVYPNLSFLLNDVDYYNTGEIDTVGWIKKGFVFRTGPSQTSAVFSIRNNAQGGGGNDWALDDVAVATCFPSMTYSPSSNPAVCENNVITIYDTVRSNFNNYTEYKWQYWAASTSGPWVDIAGSAGTAVPFWNGTAWEYVRSYFIPPAYTTAANNGDQYRLVVASTSGNLSGTTCSYSDPVSISLNIIPDCGPPLKADLLSISGKLTGDKARISWVTSKEDEPVSYTLERSANGASFFPVATIAGYNNINAENNYYSYDDPVSINGKVYYRVAMISNSGSKKYSRIIQLNLNKKDFAFGSVVNPFNNELDYEINTSVGGLAKIEIIDQYGKIVKTDNQSLYPGVNALSMKNTEWLAAGIYILKASINGNVIVHMVVKKTN